MEQGEEKKVKFEIWSHWLEEPDYKYKYGEFDNPKLASQIITDFIYGTKHDHEYIIKIITL